MCFFLFLLCGFGLSVFVILTGTGHIAAESVKRKLPAVFRRIHCIAELSWMSREDIGCYFRQFLARFVPGCTAEEWSHWETLVPGGQLLVRKQAHLD